MKRLSAADYAVDAVTAAKMLLGKWLCRGLPDGSVCKARIVETEAYCGENEPPVTRIAARRNATRRCARRVASPTFTFAMACTISSTSRIGIAYVTKRDQHRKWRFVV